MVSNVWPCEQNSELRIYLSAVDKRVETLLAEQYRRFQGTRVKYIREAFSDVEQLYRAGGSRVRPILAYAGFRARGVGAVPRRLIDVGAALELLHCAALIHDDIIDEAQIRRGLPTVCVAHTTQHVSRGWQGDSESFGINCALLSGLLSLAMADLLLVDMPVALHSNWSDMKTEMLAGEYSEVVISASGSDANEVVSGEISRMKTASYTVAGPLTLGGLLSDESQIVDSMRDFGYLVGEAYQIRDDIMDRFAPAELTGKSVGNDVRLQRPTALASAAVDIERREDDLGNDDGAMDEKALEAAIHRVGLLIEEALIILEGLDIDDRSREILASFAMWVSKEIVSREFLS